MVDFRTGSRESDGLVQAFSSACLGIMRRFDRLAGFHEMFYLVYPVDVQGADI